MTVIFGTLKDVGGQLAQGTVTVASLVTRPAHGAASTVITKERHVLPLLNGAFESPDLDPGPVLVEAASGGAFESWEVLLPEDGRHDLATLIETHVEYAPSVVGRVEAAAADANRAAQAAGQSATRAADAEHRVSLVVASAADVVRGEMQVQIDGATQARVDAESARVAAASSAEAARLSADRAENVIESTEWQGDRLSVMGKLGPPLTGPKGEKGDAGDGAGDVLWSELNPLLDDKAASAHTHSEYATTSMVEARTPEIRVVSSPDLATSPGVLYVVTGD